MKRRLHLRADLRIICQHLARAWIFAHLCAYVLARDCEWQKRVRDRGKKCQGGRIARVGDDRAYTYLFAFVFENVCATCQQRSLITRCDSAFCVWQSQWFWLFLFLGCYSCLCVFRVSFICAFPICGYLPVVSESISAMWPDHFVFYCTKILLRSLLWSGGVGEQREAAVWPPFKTLVNTHKDIYMHTHCKKN